MYTCRCRLQWLSVAACAALSAVLINSTCVGDSVALQKRSVQGARLYVITADLNDPRIKIDIGLPARGLYHSERFTNMIKRRGPVAAVTGTYFDTRSLLPVGTIVVGGKPVCVSNIGTTVYFVGSTRVRFVGTAKGESCELTGVDCGLRTGPRLLASGSYALNPRREGFRHPGLFGRHRRVAMGVTASNKLLLVVVDTPVTFGKTAGIMKLLGATDAVCLDGGTSSAMYYKGKLVCRPGRALTNILEIHWSPAYAARALPRVAAVTFIQAPRLAAAGQMISAAEASGNPYIGQVVPEHVAALPEPCFSRLAKGRHSVFPINRAKLPGLKGLEYAKNLVHISPDI
jgi:uncharacterized protein YigE (DUF2233 family)